ncbi:hypothetical protein AAFF_G00276880 [Aldrovandia affinis]|uniref:Uncharacterized protein n=1 Tax=Aldrovandia affinis TaxID=143900 RepID=A0AAD7RAB2_9TELE|nr:hypothetical protein AAFF_G00276880 [Aldrovandia affinis]
MLRVLIISKLTVWCRDPDGTNRLKETLVQCPVCLPQLLLDGTGGRNASVTCPRQTTSGKPAGSLLLSLKSTSSWTILLSP